MKPNKEMQQIQQKIANVKRQIKVKIPRKEFVHEEFEFDGASLGDVTEWYESLDFDSYGFFGQVYWKHPEREDAYQARKADINRWLTSQLHNLEAELHDIATKQAQSVSAKKEKISEDIEEYNLYLKLKEKFEGVDNVC